MIKAPLNRIYTGIIRLYSQEWEVVGYVNLLSTTTNGFKNIEIDTEGNKTIFQYKNGTYQ